jgi:hypothetical protein
MSIFNYNDIVRVRGGAPSSARPGERAWIVGIQQESDRSGDFRLEFPCGVTYTIEFDDGTSIQIEERELLKESSS